MPLGHHMHRLRCIFAHGSDRDSVEPVVIVYGITVLIRMEKLGAPFTLLATTHNLAEVELDTFVHRLTEFGRLPLGLRC